MGAGMRYRRLFLAMALIEMALIVGATAPGVAFAPDGCEQQRKQYPPDWNNTSAERKLFICESQGGRYYVKIGATDEAGRTLMSLVPFSRANASPTSTGSIVETGHDVLRIWLDQEQTTRLHDGKYFATVVRREDSCWIRGSIDEDVIFLMDNAHPKEDDPKAAGAFYNKAPRLILLGGNSLSCERLK
jgi:hypothetical protein